MDLFFAVAAPQSSLDRSPVELVLVLAFLVISLGIHEAAHGWTALKCGDTTARDLGRITLNPFPHIDLFMTIVLPLVLLISTQGSMLFGGAKPVPVNFHALRKPYRDMAIVAAAGPASNLVLAALFYAVYHLLVDTLGIWQAGTIGANVLIWSAFWNILLAMFNMLPIPPLDGSRIMAWILPSSIRPAYQRLESMGILLVIVFLYAVPGVRTSLKNTMDFMFRIIVDVVTLGGLW